MTHPVDALTESDLQAYVDDQLPLARRIEIEAALCRRPDLAVRIIVDLKTRDELRLALADAPRATRVSTDEAARRLERGVFRDRIFGYARTVAAIALLVGAGWVAHDQFGPLEVGEVAASGRPPAYVADAMMSHRTALVRAVMLSQPELPAYDAAEIRGATAIIMPSLPDGWQAMDVQVFPSTFGPSVEMAIRTHDVGTVSLFAVRPGSFEIAPREIAHKDELTAVYWQIGEVAYALVADAQTQDLEKAADRLMSTLY